MTDLYVVLVENRFGFPDAKGSACCFPTPGSLPFVESHYDNVYSALMKGITLSFPAPSGLLVSTSLSHRSRRKLSNLWTFLAFLMAQVFATCLLAQHHHHGAEGGDANAAIEKFGAVKLPISCAASVQAPFERGIALLHSFWYEEAIKQFQAVAVADPHCAMAPWALAMAEWRPFWDGMPDDRRKAGVAEIDKATSLKPKTDREQRYIAALSGYLHASAEDKTALPTYDNKMAALRAAYPEDVEATAFYGLALAANIGTQDPVGDARKALAVLEPGFQAHPDHPGFAHYIIHTCDSPQLAREALPAAERYAAIAPSSAHALHMPGHIFARLGMWPEDVESNVASVRASEYAEKNHLGGVTHQIHAYEFLLYAYLQQGNDVDAKRVLDNTEPMAEHLRSLPELANDGMTPFINYIEVEFPSIYDLEMHNWQATLDIPEPANTPDASTKYLRYWAHTIAAGHLRDVAAADKAASSAEELTEDARKEGSPIGLEIDVAEATIKAWQSFAHRNDAQALSEISAAADIQDRVGQAEIDIPAREMYADMLLLDDRPAEALVQYRTALQLSPNRYNALANAGRAAEAAGKPEESATYYAQLLKITGNGAKSHRPDVAHAQDFVDRQGTLL